MKLELQSLQLGVHSSLHYVYMLERFRLQRGATRPWVVKNQYNEERGANDCSQTCRHRYMQAETLLLNEDGQAHQH